MGFKVYFTKLDLREHTDLMYTPLDSFVFFTYTNYLEDYIRNENNNIFISLKNYFRHTCTKVLLQRSVQ